MLIVFPEMVLSTIKKLKLLIILVISSFSYKNNTLENVHKKHLEKIHSINKITVQVLHKHTEMQNNISRLINTNSFLFKDSNNLFCFYNSNNRQNNAYICVSNDTTFEIHRNIIPKNDSIITTSRYFKTSYKKLDFYAPYYVFFESDYFENSKKLEKFCKTNFQNKKTKNTNFYKVNHCCPIKK